MAVGLILGLSQANAYTTGNLVSDGWSLATSLENNKDYVYVFVDAGTSGYAVSGITTTVDWRVDDGPIPTYQTLSSPFTTPLEVWTIETRNDGYALRNIVSQDYFNSNHGGTGGGWRDYMNSDYATGSFIFETISEGKYHLKGVSSNSYAGPWNNDLIVSDNVAIAANKDPNASIGADPGPTSGFYIYKMAKATYALKYMQNTPNLTAPVDVSFLIENPTIYQAYDNNKMPAGWGDHDVNSDARTSDGAGTNTKLKIWDKGTLGIGSGKGDYFTTIGSLPNGKYRVTAGIRGNGGDASKFKAYIYQESTDTRAESPSAPNGSIADRTTDYLTINSGTANIGVHTTSTVGTTTLEADDFRMEVDPYLSTIATAEFTSGSTLTAGLWYYFDIADANEYDFTSSDAITLSYATGAKTLGEATTATFTADETKALNLEAGRLYLKADVATTLTLSYRYNVGAATLSNANGSYIQNSTFTVTYLEAATNDPSASVALATSSKATVNGNEVALSAVTNGFSLDLGSLTANTDYHIVIPAGVYGYDGESMNAAIDVTIHTPAIFDGVYYLYNTWTESYLSRSGAYGTAAIVDNKGLAVHITTDASNNTKLKFFDNLLFVGYNGFCYGDVQDEDALKLNVTAVPGGYKFLNTSNSAYFAVFNGHTVGDAVEGDNLQGTSNIWALESTSEHIANYTVNANVQAAEAASNIPSLSSITTKAELDAELTANYNETPIAITGSKNEKYQEYAGADYELVENEYYKETIENLTPGLYKLSVDAFQRAAWNDWVTNADGARGTIYLYANGAKTQLKSVFEYGANEAYTQGTNPNYESKGLNYPNSKEAGYAALETGNYKNEVYVYVPDNGEGKGTLVIGINNPTRQGYEVKNGTWAVYDNWTLTYYDQTAANMTITSAKYATFVAPFDVEIPSGVTAYTVDDVASNGSTLKITEVTSGTIEKNTPVVLYSESTVNETFYGKTVDGTPTEGLLTGVYERTAVPNGSYVLQNNGGKVGFYLVDTSKATPSVNANRAYLTIDRGAVKAFFFGEDTATAIQGVFDGAESGEVYDIAGRKLGKLQKGVNIVNGKKVLVK